MTTDEFSNQFDVLYNNIASNASPGLNEYEKSVMLTKAQEEIVKNYFNPKGNKYEEGFDGSAKRQIDFANLMLTATCNSISGANFDLRGQTFLLPQDLFLMINEIATTDTGVKQVIPIKYDEYARLMSKPYKEPLKYQAWRLITQGDDTAAITAEIICHSGETVSEYKVRYLRRPRPIILTDLASEYGEITIHGISDKTECELNPLVHEEILQRAIELAKITYAADVNAVLESGKRSE